MAVFPLQTSNVFSYTFAGQLGQGTSYLQASNNNPIFNIGGQSWTIECWFKPVGLGYRSYDGGSAWGAIFSKRLGSSATSSYLGYIQATSSRIGFYNGTEYASQTTLSPNVWSHVAYVFNQGANLRIFVNGSNVLTTTAVTSIVNNEARFYIGKNDGESNQIVGDISNFRITLGQALYSGESFNVSTYPVQLPNNAIGPHAGGANVAASLTGNVIFLTCNDQIIKANGNTLINGFTSVGVVHPHVVDTTELQNYSFANFDPSSTANSAQTSGSFMLTTDSANLNIPSGDFTIECWAYTTSNAALTGVDGYIIQKGQLNNVAWQSWAISAAFGNVYFSGSNTNLRLDIGGDGSNGVGGNVHRGFIGTWTPNTWNHIAIVRTGTTYNGYLNGVLGYTETTANTPYNSTGRGIVMMGGFENASNTWTAGGVSNKRFNGYITDARITKRAMYPANTNFTPPQTPLQLHPSTVFLMKGPGNPVDVAGSVTISSNGTGTIFFSTNNPYTANAIVNANATSSMTINYGVGQEEGRIYNKFDFQRLGQMMNIYAALAQEQGRIYDKEDIGYAVGPRNDAFTLGQDEGRIYNKLDFQRFSMQTQIYHTLAQDQGRIYNKLEVGKMAFSVPLTVYTLGQDQGRIYAKQLTGPNFAYIPVGGLGSGAEYQFWS